MPWNDTQTESDEITHTEWNNMVTCILSTSSNAKIASSNSLSYIGHSSNTDVHFPSSNLLEWLGNHYAPTGTTFDATLYITSANALNIFAGSSSVITKIDSKLDSTAGSGAFYPSSLGKSLMDFSSNASNLYAPKGGSGASWSGASDYISFSSNVQNLYDNLGDITWGTPTQASGVVLVGTSTISGALKVTLSDIPQDVIKSGANWQKAYMSAQVAAYTADTFNATLYITSSNAIDRFVESGLTLNAISANTMAVAQYLYHIGNQGTHLNFGADTFELDVGGTCWIKIDDAEGNIFYINQDFNDRDFQVQGNNSYMLYDGGVDYLGIGLDPKYKLHVNGAISAQAYSGNILKVTTVSCQTFNGPSTAGEYASTWTWATPTASSGLSVSNTGKVSGNLALYIDDYIASTSAVSRFADSSNIQSKFVHSGIKLNAVSANNMAIDNRLYNLGQQDTYLEFQPGRFDFYAGGDYLARWEGSPLAQYIVNPSGANYIDFHIYGEGGNVGTPKYMVRTDTLNKRVGLGDVQTLSYNTQVSGSFYAPIISGGSLDIGGSTKITGILDEDNLGSDSDTDLATQQSIKKYIDDNSTFNATLYMTSANIIANYVTSTNAHTNFYPSSKIISTTPASGEVLTYKADNKRYENELPVMMFTTPTIKLASGQNINLTRFDCPAGENVYIWRAGAANSGGACTGDLYIELLSGSTSIYKTSSTYAAGYPLAKSYGGPTEVRFMYSSTSGYGSEENAAEYGTSFMQISVY